MISDRKSAEMAAVEAAVKEVKDQRGSFVVEAVRVQMIPWRYATPQGFARQVELSVRVNNTEYQERFVLPADARDGELDWLLDRAVRALKAAVRSGVGQ